MRSARGQCDGLRPGLTLGRRDELPVIVPQLDDLLAEGVQHRGPRAARLSTDFSSFKANCEDDRRVIGALGSVITGSHRPLVVTSGTGMANTVPGQPATEDGAVISSDVIPRAASEEAAAALAAAGVNVSVVRLPQVHDTFKQGLLTCLIAIAREKGVCAYVGDGRNRWPAAHVVDAAHLYRLSLEKARPGAIHHAVAEEGVSHRDMADAIGRRLKLPVESIAEGRVPDHFGWLAMFVLHDMPARSERTRQVLGWHPSGPGLIADLGQLCVPDL